jgi:Heparinase II/III-like protein
MSAHAAPASPLHRFVAHTLVVCLWSICLAACGRQQDAHASTADVESTGTAARTPQARIAPGIPLDLGYVDRTSPAFARFRRWVDNAVAGEPGYAFSAYDAAVLYRLDPQKKYCDLAVAMIEREVADAETAIADGRAPEIAGDSYLDVGPRIAALSMTLDTCKAQIDDAQRGRWSVYAEQAVWNVWHALRAHWGARPRPWTGWSVDNPGNNYHYSFVEATLYWALASGNNDWMRFLREEKIPPLKAYFATLPGGGSLEGTGYGAAHMRLFALYRLWRDATGEDIANANPHADDSIAYWVHATVPTMDRFAPIGDQSRSSIPEIYDYHRRLVLEARALSGNPDSQALASWWLHRISIPKMSNGFNTLHDLLPSGDADAPAPETLFHHAEGTGHLFARSGWDKNAMWLAFVAGPYNESHAHQEQGGFTLFAHDWLAVTENIWTHSGIQQGTETHNVLRFERDTADRRVIHQHQSGASRMTVTPGADGALRVDADLTGAYDSDAPVRHWTRALDFAGRTLRVEDRFVIGPGHRAVFQLNLPVEPKIDGQTAIAGRLRVRVIAPADARLTKLDWRSLDNAEFNSGWRLDIAGGTETYVVELQEASN